MRVEHLKLYCKIAVSKNIVSRALKISFVVGSALNIINQGESIVTLNFTDLNYIKLALTYIVPYSVTTYTATVMKLEFHIGTHAIAEVDLECKNCKSKIHIKENEVIPECSSCGVQTHWKLI